MGLPLRFYQVSRSIFRRRSEAAEIAAFADRPPGDLIWIHAPQVHSRSVVGDLIAVLEEAEPGLSFLVTTRNPRPERLPAGVLRQVLPPEDADACAAFAAHWHPLAGLWLSGSLRPQLLAEVAHIGASLFLLDTGNAIETARRLRPWPGLTSATLGLFHRALVGDRATADALAAAGMPADRIELTGVLEHAALPLGCNEAEREALASVLKTRPVWLAAQIHISELESILAAHRQAMRRAHRLLLIVVPSDPGEAAAYRELIEAQGLNFAHRSRDEEPDSETQLYLADTEGEMGLWYRLAPIAFMGRTLSAQAGDGPDPFDAAALGSVVLHGPWIQPHQNAFHRLARADAAMQISHPGELALALEALLSPERTAEMAHAAWQITTAGAEVTERVSQLVGEERRARVDAP